MTAYHPELRATSRALPARPATIDIAGSAWPVYKLEALVAGVLAGLALALIVGSGQVAVLAAAAVTSLVWIVGLVRARS
ncbi:hypothetical protein GV794_09265 [Nocardia cyriacigeorgica]|uniref:Uncharacterized protein n=1 Tax=Nocardia cyriacigeorgica TaxID=135487 RepID=A0ABX0CH12_9NOCA|nr:hypothetical protein [Nocardia cyriacigeorgica]NEW41536.1 hypothetical protein [Nocardia cyriacigeorgica]NEW52048.1 hypothetical protein [Nocardia cyriacigeorgica]NEW55841.1 hypothetical protein [Nocardia cyriacigeorgica]